MRCNKYLLLVWILLVGGLTGALFSQGTITGKVTAPDGSAVEGVTVFIQKLSQGTFTDENGRYKLANVPVGTHTLAVRMLGYAQTSEQVAVSNGETTTVNVSMDEQSLSTEEVVVVGYGVSRKRDLVGAISKVDSEDLNDIPGGSFETALQGKVPGIQVTQSGGGAGSGAVIRIRGVGTLSSGGDPLIIIDGIPITQDNFLNNGQNGSGGGSNYNPLAFLNPNDIESISVLKDASATAVYGSRGANGVILITTKRGGQDGKVEWNFNSRLGISEPVSRLNVMNSAEWLQIRQEAWENDGNVGRAPLPANYTAAGFGYEDAESIDTDWQDLVIRTGFKQEYNLSMRYGKKKFSTYVGLGYLDGESYQFGNSFKRISGRANFDYRPSEKLTISLNTSLARGDNDRVRQGFAGGLGAAWSTALPIYPIRDKEGNFYNIYSNPVAQEQLQDWRSVETRSVGGLNIMFKPIKDLTVSAVVNADLMWQGDYFTEDTLWTTVDYISKANRNRIVNLNSYLTANYDIPLPKDHNLSVMVGAEYQNNRRYLRYQEAWGNDQHFFEGLDTAATYNNIDLSGTGEHIKFGSVFSRLKYIFKDRYLFQFTFRRDGSSNFLDSNQYADFPAVGAGWILSEEKFIQNIKVISYLKVKASYGASGNANVPWTNSQDNFSGNGNNLTPTPELYNGQLVRYQNSIGNSDLQWERSQTFDASIEIGLWNDRVFSEMTYFRMLTKGAFINIALQASAGVPNATFADNIGVIENQGFEFGITTRNLVNEFKWTTRFNFTAMSNTVLEVGAATPDALAGGFGDTRAIPGEAVQTNYIVRFSHVDPATGRPVYLTGTGEETNTYSVTNNRYAVGNGFPDVFGGLTNQFSWKNFDLNTMFYFSLGGKIYDDAAKRHMGVVTDDWNMRRDYFDRWRAPGDVARYPRATMSMLNWGGNDNFWQNNHSLWLEDASFVRLRTVDFGYNIKPKKGKVTNIRLSIQGTNLLTFTNYTGVDPEVARERTNSQERNIGGTNITFLTPPNERTVTGGINVTF